jgi:hypothetical protein
MIKNAQKLAQVFFCLCLISILAACNGQQDGSSLLTEEQPQLQQTLTQTPNPEHSNSLQASPQALSSGDLICDRAAPGRPIDVTVPDESTFRPGDVFTKTWRLVNAGDCTWTENYAIVWFSGEPLGSARIQFLDSPVRPGESVDLSVELTAPSQIGTYQSNWKLRNTDGQLFGLGPQGDAPIWVRIHVSSGATATPSPLPTRTPTPLVYQQGEFELQADIRLDFDSGGLDTGETDDVIISFENEAVKLTPLDGTLVGLTPSDIVPGQTDCKARPLSSEAVTIPDLSRRAYICYQSNQGLPGYLWLGMNESGTTGLKAGFMTWFVP